MNVFTLPRMMHTECRFIFARFKLLKITTHFVYIRTYSKTYIRTYSKTYVRTYIRTYAKAYFRTYIRTYARTYIRTYIK